MVNIVGVQFKGNGRIYYFDPNGLNFNLGEYVIVETVRGLELGKIIIANQTIPKSKVENELKPVIRKATEQDIEQEEKNNQLALKSFEVFKRLVEQCNLDMKPLYCEYTIDRSKVIFYYTSDERVDFRDLLKLLTPEFHMRVELRQIGPREAARVVGGMASCGRELCCAKHLRDFDLVTMKMAKDQAMSLNTTKISGACGKLMCCIAYENDLYLEIKKELPSLNSWVKTPSCNFCKVVGLDYVQRLVKTAENEEGMPSIHPAEVVEVVKNEKKKS